MPQQTIPTGEAMLRVIADSLPGCACYLDADLRFTFANRRYHDWFGVDPERLPGVSLIDLIGEFSFRERRPYLDRALAGETVTFLAHTHLSDGRLIDAEVHYAPDMREGEVCGLVAIVADVTERKRSNEALAKLINDSPFGIYMVDADFKLVHVSAGAQKVFENVRPLLQRDFAEVLRIIWPEPFATTAIQIFRHTLETGETYHSPATVERRSDIGQVEAYDWKVERLTMPDGRDGAVCHFYDLSERQRFEAALQESEEKLRVANESLEERVRHRTKELQVANKEMEGFTYSIAHDLRAPLRAILATSKMLIEDLGQKLDAENRALLERQATNAARLADLIDDLLTHARVSRQQPKRKPVDFTDLVREVAEHAVSAPRTIDIEPGMMAIADPALLKIVVENLLSNANKYSPSGGAIRVGTKVVDGKTHYFFSDEGIGFEMRYADRLFLPFERLHREGQFPGTGIGLANVKRIIERHGGQVGAESKGQDAGAMFWFTLD